MTKKRVKNQSKKNVKNIRVRTSLRAGSCPCSSNDIACKVSNAHLCA